MNIYQIGLILLTVVLLSIGQILFKLSASALVLNFKGFVPSLFSIKLIIALFVYGVATLLWVVALKELPLRIVYPFVSLGFFIVPILSSIFLGEAIGWNTFVGALIIAFGVGVSVYR